MATDLKLFGPFAVKCTDTRARVKQIDSSAEFWAAIPQEIPTKNGVYVFARRAGKGFQPIYVGKATKGFRQEALSPSNLKKYNRALANGERGTPVMFFVAPDGKKNKVPRPICDEIETFLIQLAVRKNPNLMNDKKTALAQWSIRGLVRGGKGRPKKDERSFGIMIGL